MAITNSFARFLFHLKKDGVNFDTTLTLGRLRLYTKPQLLNKAARDIGVDLDFTSTEGQAYSEGFFKTLGTTKLDSIDYSDYEKAVIIHDLNCPLPIAMNKKYSVVLDSGTLEHVFNFPTAIKSCMEALHVGGTYIGVTPANNMMGHGFYQFSPELFYRIFSEDNGFKVTHMLIGIHNDDGDVEKWYEAKDPATVKARVTLKNFKETYLFIAARKIIDVPVLQSSPFQSDYVAAWDTANDINHDKLSLAKKIYKKNVPETGQNYIRKIKNYFLKSKTLQDESIGFIDPANFTEIEL